MTSTRQGEDRRIGLKLRVETVTKALILISIVLLVLSYGGQLAVRAFDWHPERDIVSFFNVDRERNLPTSFQSMLFLFSSLVLAAITVLKKVGRDRWTLHWGLLALIFAGLAWDEVTEVHERFIEPMRRAFDLQGIFFFGWIVPAGIVVALVGLAYLRFVRALEPPIRTFVIIAGTVFLSGALLLEGVGGWYYERIDQNANMTYVTIATIEESLEMAGLIIFLHAMLSYLSATLHRSRITLAGQPGTLWIDAEGDTPDNSETRRENPQVSRREPR